MAEGIVVIINKEGKILLIEEGRDLLRGCWAPPHGRLEKNETEEQAVVRETKEEVGLVVKPTKRIITMKADTKVKTVAFWEAEYVEGEIEVDENEVSGYGWFNLEEALDLKLYPGTRKFLEGLGVKNGKK